MRKVKIPVFLFASILLISIFVYVTFRETLFSEGIQDEQKIGKGFSCLESSDGSSATAANSVQCFVMRTRELPGFFRLRISVDLQNADLISLTGLSKEGVVWPAEGQAAPEGKSELVFYVRQRLPVLHMLLRTHSDVKFSILSWEFVPVNEGIGLPAPSSQTTSLASTIEAQSLFQRIKLNKALRKQSDLNKALLLNQFVFNYCTFEPPLEPDTNKLFENCRTQCGGYAYVLKELLATAGVPSRQVVMYNIPIQGNHSLTEALVDGRWILLDPTFGMVFRSRAGDYLSLEDLEFRSYFQDPLPLLSQAKKRTLVSLELAEAEVKYGDASFAGLAMESHYYTKPEAYGVNKSTSLIQLGVSLSAQSPLNSLGTFTGDQEACQKAYLEETNQLLNDENPFNDTSYVTSHLGPSASGRFTPVISLRDLVPQESYSLRLYVLTGAATTLLPKAQESLALDIAPDSLEVPQGGHEVRLPIVAKGSNGLIILDSKDFATICGYELEVL